MSVLRFSRDCIRHISNKPDKISPWLRAHETLDEYRYRTQKHDNYLIGYKIKDSKELDYIYAYNAFFKRSKRLKLFEENYHTERMI